MSADALQARAFAAFDALLGAAPKPNLVALSGGPDSTALLVLLARWSHARGRPAPRALVIDHGLRSGARQEAERVVARWQGYLGCQLGCHTLDPKPGPSQDALRRARYATLTRACLAQGAGQLLTGHQADDQLETLAERLSRGSQVAGLAGLSSDRLLLADPEAPRLLRPLLFARKADLEAMLDAEGLAYETDPSNRSDRYARARWRGLMPQLAQHGITAAVLHGLAAASAALIARQDQRIEQLLARHARWHDDWLIELDAAALEPLEPSTRARLLSGLTQLVGWRGYPAQSSQVLRLRAGQSLSLNRCRLTATAQKVWIVRDPRCLGDMDQGPWQPTAACGALALRIRDHIPEGPQAWPGSERLGSLPQSVAKFAPVTRNSQGDWQLATKSVLALAPQFHTVDQSYRLVTSAMQLRFTSHA